MASATSEDSRMGPHSSLFTSPWPVPVPTRAWKYSPSLGKVKLANVQVALPKRRQRRTCPSCCVEKPWNVGFGDADVACNDKLIALEVELDKAVYKEDHGRVSELRDEIAGLQMTSYVDILSANMKFYKAFTKGSMVDMGACWLRTGNVSCKHPLGELSMGFWDVLDSFRALLSTGVPDITPSNIRISLRGSIAIVTCEENSKLTSDMEADRRALATEWNENFSSEPAAIVMSATNIFEKKNGQWYLIHHVSSPASPLE